MQSPPGTWWVCLDGRRAQKFPGLDMIRPPGLGCKDRYFSLEKSRVPCQMSVMSKIPSTQPSSLSRLPEYQVTSERVASIGAMPAYDVSPALGSSPHSLIESAPPSRSPVIS